MEPVERCRHPAMTTEFQIVSLHCQLIHLSSQAVDRLIASSFTSFFFIFFLISMDVWLIYAYLSTYSI